MRNLPRLAFVLFTGTVIMIFCTLLLSPGFLAADKRPSASRKEQVFIKEEKEENRRAYSNPGLPSTQQQFGRLVSLDTYLLARSFTEEQVKCRTLLLFSPLTFLGQINSELSVFISNYENELMINFY